MLEQIFLEHLILGHFNSSISMLPNCLATASMENSHPSHKKTFLADVNNFSTVFKQIFFKDKYFSNYGPEEFLKFLQEWL
jgi:hypothetical protein